MSLLTNEDFAIYQLRAGYLQHIKDGVGERLITINTSVLNNPAFRSAGWTPNISDIKRTYSPPIPTAIAPEYFQAPPRQTGLPVHDEDEEGGMVTGQGSHDAISIVPHNKRSRRRKEQLEEDDSSDLSDDSDDDDDNKRAAQGIKFSKMPVRHRAASSPPRSSQPHDHEQAQPQSHSQGQDQDQDVSLVITQPSRPDDGPSVRPGSLNAVDFYRSRPRRDTTTSSEFSSENDFDSSAFRKQKVQTRQMKNTQMFATRIEEEEDQQSLPQSQQQDGDSDLEDDDVGEASDLSDDFEGTGESASLLGMGAPLMTIDTLEDSPAKDAPKIPPAITPHSSSSPKRQRQHPPPSVLPRLPTGRPISYVQPVSLLSKALKGTGQKSEDPFRQFAQLSGKGEANPLWIKIHAPFSTESSKPFEVPLRRSTNDGAPVTVAELIGLSLWRYADEKREPPIEPSDMNVNRWTLRMVEDDEVDFDFPALGRARPVVDFTSNNNRPPMRRARDKPWDEFALVRATDEQFNENQEVTPQFAEQISAPANPPPTSSQTSLAPTPVPDISRTNSSLQLPLPRTSYDAPTAPSYVPNANPITSSFAPMARKNLATPLLDAPTATGPRSTPRNGVPKTVTIHYTDPQSFQTTLLPIPTTSDTYLAELFTLACQRLNLDKALHVLKVRGTQTVAPQDRTVEALGSRLFLDLVRRRFVGVGDGWGTHSGAGSPGSESPNAPLLLTTGTTPKQKSRKAFMGLQSSKSSTDIHAAAIYGLGSSAGKRYLVIRRQPLSFAPSHPRILALDGEFMHIMPASSADALTANIDAGMAPPAGKTTSVHLSSVVGCKVSRKHPKVVRVLVYREKETKRYDFEAGNKDEATEIAGTINRGMLKYRDADDI